MKKEEFRESKLVKGKLVNVGVDDYGQQFFIEYEQDGKLQEVGCGCYVADYDTFIESWFNEPEPFYAHLDERLKEKFKTVCDDAGLTISEALNIFMKKSIHDNSLPLYMKSNSKFDLNEFIYYVVETYKEQYEYSNFKDVIDLFEDYKVFNFLCENAGVLHFQSLEETCEDVKRYIEVRQK